MSAAAGGIVAGRRNRPRGDPLSVISAAVLAAFAVAVPFHKHHHHKGVHHRRGCHTRRCDRRADDHFARRIARQRGREAMSALEACIISHESGGNPQAVNGQYEGIGQWEPSRWVSDGGTRYASTPLGASYAEQEKVLRGEGEAGMRQQQGQYDGCG